MPFITSVTTGRILHTNAEFAITPKVAFYVSSVLSEELPSSVEGRTAYKVTEAAYATVQVVIDFYSGDKVSELLHSEIVDGISEPNTTTYEESMAFNGMSDEHKKKMQIRIRKLLEGVAKREAIQSNVELLAGTASIEEAQNDINTQVVRINRLLLLNTQKPLIEMQPMLHGIEEYLKLYAATDVDGKKLTEKLFKIAKAGYALK